MDLTRRERRASERTVSSVLCFLCYLLFKRPVVFQQEGTEGTERARERFPLFSLLPPVQDAGRFPTGGKGGNGGLGSMTVEVGSDAPMNVL
jgi:hypothetical protein